MWVGDTVYFLSDRDGGFVNLFSYSPVSGAVRQLTDEGMNLEGIRRVMHLEIENARLRAELDQAREIVTRASRSAWAVRL